MRPPTELGLGAISVQYKIGDYGSWIPDQVGNDKGAQSAIGFVVHPHHIHLLLCNSTEAKYLRPSPIILTTFVLSTSAHFGEMRCGGRRN